MPFFRRKSAVPGIFRQFRQQKSVLLTIEPCLMAGIVINNIFEWKNNEIKGKSPMKICKNGEFRYFRPEKDFSQKSDSMFWAFLICIFVQKIRKKLMMKSRENAQKPVFPAYFRNFRPEKNFFFKSGSVTFWALPFCTFVPKIRKS